MLLEQTSVEVMNWEDSARWHHRIESKVPVEDAIGYGAKWHSVVSMQTKGGIERAHWLTTWNFKVKWLSAEGERRMTTTTRREGVHTGRERERERESAIRLAGRRVQWTSVRNWVCGGLGQSLLRPVQIDRCALIEHLDAHLATVHSACIALVAQCRCSAKCRRVRP